MNRWRNIVCGFWFSCCLLLLLLLFDQFHLAEFVHNYTLHFNITKWVRVSHHTIKWSETSKIKKKHFTITEILSILYVFVFFYFFLFRFKTLTTTKHNFILYYLVFIFFCWSMSIVSPGWLPQKNRKARHRKLPFSCSYV